MSCFHHWTGREEEQVIVKVFYERRIFYAVLDSLRLVLVAGLQDASNRSLQLTRLDRFAEIVSGPKFDGLDDLAGVVGTRHHHYFLLRTEFLAAFQCPQSVHSRYAKINQDQARTA